MKARALLNWNLYTKCPYCGHDFDLADHDEDGFYSKPIFSNKWDELDGADVECPSCGQCSQISEVVY